MAGAVSATSHVIVEFIGLFLAGLLAGVEFVVRYGVQPALRRLEDRAHLLARIPLVQRMRFVVPALIVPTVVAAVVTVVLDGHGTGCWFGWAGPRGTDRLPGNCVRGNRAHQHPGDRMGRRQPTRGLGDRDQTVGAD